MQTLFVVTEHRSFLGKEKEAHYELVRRRLEHAAGSAVEGVHYEEVDGLKRARAVVLSGSFAPWAAHDPGALDRLREKVLAFSGPVLGICAGMQLQALFAGGSLGSARQNTVGEYRSIEILDDDDLLRGLRPQATVYEHHGDEVKTVPEGFRTLATSPSCAIEAIADRDRLSFGTQFHPEEFTREYPAGERVLRNFFELVWSG